MPQYQKYAENWTLAANTSLWGYWLSWENIPGVGPNMGPLLIGADPVSHQSAEVDLAVFDLAKCRRAPDANGKTEVFYQFGFRNLSQIDAAFGFEVILFKDLMP
jgi:hypothetical protein